MRQVVYDVFFLTSPPKRYRYKYSDALGRVWEQASKGEPIRVKYVATYTF